MELRLGNIVSKLPVLLLSSLFGDVGKFVSRVQIFLQTFSMIFSDTCDEQVLPKLSCNCKAQSSVVEERISVAEMSLMMNRLGIMACEDINGNSSVGVEDVVALFAEEEPSLDEIKETFGVLDANNDGFIEASDLHRIISNLGLKESYDLEDYKRMIKAFDSNGDGLIDFQDFVKVMEKCLC